MAVLFSNEFNVPEERLKALGVFNTFLDEDSHFFINIKRLQVSNIPEFKTGYTKVTSNPDCVHGLEIQIEEYAKAEGTNKKVFVLVNTGQNEKRIDSVMKKQEEMLVAGMNPAKVVVVDARIKNAASTHQ